MLKIRNVLFDAAKVKSNSFVILLGVIGGTLTGPLIFILPPLFYTKLLQLEKRFDKRMLESTSLQTDLNDTELLLSPSRYGYGSIQSPKYRSSDNEIINVIKKIWSTVTSQCILAGTVIIFGMMATFTSTFYNILDIKDLNEFWSPCIQNISLSYILIPK